MQNLLCVCVSKQGRAII